MHSLSWQIDWFGDISFLQSAKDVQMEARLTRFRRHQTKTRLLFSKSTYMKYSFLAPRKA